MNATAAVDAKHALKVLVVDDEPGMCQMLQWTLKRLGLSVDAARDGKEGLKKAEKEHYDLVITDLTMPVVDGLELLRQMKKIAPKTAVVIVTGFGALETAVYAMKQGASDFILKPFNIEKLAGRLQEAVNSNGRCRHCGHS